MQILEISTEGLLDAQQVARSRGGERSGGAHVSELIRDIQNKVTHKGKRKPFDQLSAEERRRMGNYTSLGWAFELIIERALREVWSDIFLRDERYVKTGELFLDGVVGTPDWFDTFDVSVIEFKATWRSSRRDLRQDFTSWMWQIKAYCKMMATTTARLYVFFVNGNYRESGPQLKGFALTFTQQEIDDNWAMLIQHMESLNGG
jgi:hypothetical protein